MTEEINYRFIESTSDTIIGSFRQTVTVAVQYYSNIVQTTNSCQNRYILRHNICTYFGLLI